jgi:HAE1 family hydrophobic/amphiphilic exporter-1
MMTTLSSVLGLVPMALGIGEGAEIRTPMAITVIGGLMFSTLLTLVFIPVVYELVDRKRYEVTEELPGALPSPAAGD